MRFRSRDELRHHTIILNRIRLLRAPAARLLTHRRVEETHRKPMQISIVIVEPGPDVEITQSSQCSEEETHFEEVINVLRNLLRGGMQPMSIAYTSNDCVITLSTDRKDWPDFFTTRNPDTGRSPKSKDLLLALKAIDVGLGTSAEPAEDVAQRALLAGVKLVRRDGIRVAMSQEELLKEGQDRID